MSRHPELMVRYAIASLERPPTHMAEYIRFDGALITEIEVYIGREAS